MKVLLLYFSATGNTRYVMHVLAEKLMAHHALVSCLDMEENDHITESMDYLVIGYPKYCEKVPPYVETYVRNCLIKQPVEIPTLLMTTQVGPTKVCTHPLRKILKEKNYYVVGGDYVMLANNFFLHGFKQTDAKVLKKRVEAATKQLETLATAIVTATPPQQIMTKSQDLMGYYMGSLYYKCRYYVLKQLTVDTSCVGCGTCAKRCPLQNIKLDQHQPQLGERCMLCTRCLNECPKQAFLYKGIPYPQYKGIIKK